jgi:hypothetical protein
MKTITTIAALAAIAGVAQAGSTIAFNENFEGAAQYTTSVAEFSDGTGDFWGNTQNITFGSFVEYFGADGNYFAGMDLDGEGASVPLTQTFDTFSIAGLTDLTLSIDLAEDQDGSNEDWDDLDFVDFEYQVDGGAWQNLFSVLPIDDPGTTFNQEPAINGMAGMEITDTFSTFSFDLTGVTGSDLAIRAIWSLDSGDEDLAIDNLVVSGIPSPGAAALFGLAGLSAARRRRA